jgi:hypothetical protein
MERLIITENLAELEVLKSENISGTNNEMPTPYIIYC